MSEPGPLSSNGHVDMVQIEPFIAQHQAEVRALILSGLTERWGTIDHSLNRDLDDIARSYSSGQVIVVTRGPFVVGTGAIVPRPAGTAEILRMSVASIERRHGIGRMLVDALLDVARSWPVQRVILETTSHWSSAIEFYKACGFQIDYEVAGGFGLDTYLSIDIR